jgi:hypothetical protein
MQHKNIFPIRCSILSTEDQGEYFTAILLRSGCIYMDEEPTVIRYQVIKTLILCIPNFVSLRTLKINSWRYLII